ncbi:hypothetical protein NPIL_343371 [Nephila pilipes]|uniref:Uncharacterized protein n=1 Tax=Nephila pilipes TaxID=299642 RepID=A0A8X6UN14_NEPPI|nr:hypothetical protein NPIL_343371 [Nephila pilipes]
MKTLTFETIVTGDESAAEYDPEPNAEVLGGTSPGKGRPMKVQHQNQKRCCFIADSRGIIHHEFFDKVHRHEFLTENGRASNKDNIDDKDNKNNIDDKDNKNNIDDKDNKDNINVMLMDNEVYTLDSIKYSGCQIRFLRAERNS